MAKINTIVFDTNFDEIIGDINARQQPNEAHKIFGDRLIDSVNVQNLDCVEYEHCVVLKFDIGTDHYRMRVCWHHVRYILEDGATEIW